MIQTSSVKNFKKGRMDMLQPRVPKYPLRKEDVRTDHPKDTGTSVWDTALFDIDKYEADE